MVNGSLNASYGQTHTSCTIRGVGGDFTRPSLCLVFVVCVPALLAVCPAGNFLRNYV